MFFQLVNAFLEVNDAKIVLMLFIGLIVFA
jgi:hypothetical protein